MDERGPPKMCRVARCDQPHYGRGYCRKHWRRWYIHGDPMAMKRAPDGAGWIGKHGYRILPGTGHPAASPSGRLPEHRLVLWEKIGPGVHACYWCHRQVRWDAPQGDPEYMEGDHLNGEVTDNRPENLVPACRPCNGGRHLRTWGSSGHKGVSWDKHRQRWAAYGNLAGKKVNLGRYNTEEEAAEAARRWYAAVKPLPWTIDGEPVPETSTPTCANTPACWSRTRGPEPQGIAVHPRRRMYQTPAPLSSERRS
jgi:hypothetical protein